MEVSEVRGGVPVDSVDLQSDGSSWRCPGSSPGRAPSASGSRPARLALRKGVFQNDAKNGRKGTMNKLWFCRG